MNGFVYQNINSRSRILLLLMTDNNALFNIYKKIIIQISSFCLFLLLIEFIVGLNDGITQLSETIAFTIQWWQYHLVNPKNELVYAKYIHFCWLVLNPFKLTFAWSAAKVWVNQKFKYRSYFIEKIIIINKQI